MTTEVDGFVVTDELLDFMMADVPPCGVWHIRNLKEVLCGKPAVARIKFTCKVCEHKATVFLCATDYERAKKQMLRCANCAENKRMGNDYELKDL